MAIAAGCFEQLNGPLDRKFIRRQVLRNARGFFAALQIRPVTANADVDLSAFGIGAERQRVDLACVDLFELLHDHVSQAARATAAIESGAAALFGAKVKALQPRHRLGFTLCDLVEFIFHARGEGVVDENREVLFQQTDDRKGLERRDERGLLLPNVTALHDGPDDARVG